MSPGAGEIGRQRLSCTADQPLDFFVGGNLATVKGVINGQATHGLEAAALVACWGFEWLICSGWRRWLDVSEFTLADLKQSSGPWS
jgi:hypothetical protein